MDTEQHGTVHSCLVNSHRGRERRINTIIIDISVVRRLRGSGLIGGFFEAGARLASGLQRRFRTASVVQLTVSENILLFYYIMLILEL